MAYRGKVPPAAIDTVALKKRMAADDSTYRDARSTHNRSTKPTGNADLIARQAFARGTARSDTLNAARKGQKKVRQVRHSPIVTAMLPRQP
jgi:hypothetical protein